MKTSKKLLSALGVAFIGLSLILSSPLQAASQPRDNDSNAIMYGGAYSITELKSNFNNGTGKEHQSASQLQKLYAYYGIYEKDFGQLKDGYVTKDNQVIVDGKVLKSDVTTMGRHDIAGSKRNNDFSYPLYLRHPSVSFLSEKLPAFVSVNYDGSYAYAIIKPCGNIVVGPGVKTKPVVKKPVTPVKPVKVVTPVTTVTPVVQTQSQEQTQAVYVEASKATAMPTSGPAEAAAGAVGLTSTAGAGWAWLRSKKSLLTAIKKIK